MSVLWIKRDYQSEWWKNMMEILLFLLKFYHALGCSYWKLFETMYIFGFFFSFFDVKVFKLLHFQLKSNNNIIQKDKYNWENNKTR